MKSMLIGGLLSLLLLAANVNAADNLVGKKAPEFTLRKWVTANPPNTKRPEHKIYVVEFWATWCAPCVRNIPHLNELTEKYRSKGVEFVALSQDRSETVLRNFLKGKKINYYIALDNGTVDSYKVECYPTAFVVDHTGTITWRGNPASFGFEGAIKKAVASSPLPALAGVDLGPFKNQKEALRGGKDFAKSYSKIKAYADKKDRTEKSAFAKRIIKSINEWLEDRTERADKLKKTNPTAAYKIYASLVDNYDGIEAISSAKSAYLQFKNR
jgi:thiol-disulfide isomerase/thioredoxin